jgi:hypothetical protein
MNYAKIIAGTLAALLLSVFSGCGGIWEDNNEDALYELAGRWYDNSYDFAFEITPTGEGYIAKSKTHCNVSVLGSFVSFKDSRGLIGSFNYSIKKGELTMTLGAGDFSGVLPSSPFVKSGTIPSDGAVPVEFIGKWYAQSNTSPSPNFEITKSGAMTILGSPTPSYTANISGNTVSVLEGSMRKGTFQYSFIYGEMSITNGTDDCAGLAVLSPFVKKNS